MASLGPNEFKKANAMLIMDSIAWTDKPAVAGQFVDLGGLGSCHNNCLRYNNGSTSDDKVHIMTTIDFQWKKYFMAKWICFPLIINDWILLGAVIHIQNKLFEKK